MRHFIAYALVVIALAALTVWLVSRFIQPILPPGVNADLLLFVAALSGVLGMPGAIKNTVELLRMASQKGDESREQSVLSPIIESYLQRGSWNKKDYEAALKRYLGWLSASTGRVWLRGIKRGDANAIELSVDAIYVPLAAETLPEAREQISRGLSRENPPREMPGAERITMRDLLSQGNHLAVIGAPGCGKTTVLQHIAWTLAEALSTGRPELAAERLGLTGPLPLPIYIPLSLYADHRRRFADHPDPRQRQLATFIIRHLQERQAVLGLPDDFSATLFEPDRHLILLLDGLDEVPNEEDRALVSQAVRDLKFGQPNTRFVVTSRTPAYVGRAVLGDEFRVVNVLPLDEEQVASLIRRAYQAIFPKDVQQEERDRYAGSLIAGVENLERERAARMPPGEERRLVTTPLMVRMLLIVHFNLRRRLPDQRAELYMEVVDTLLTSFHNPDEAVAQQLAQLGGDWRGRREMHQFLAFQMHSRGHNAGREISEREMTGLLCAYLEARQHRAPEVAEQLVADMVATSRQRGGLLEEQAGRYRFSHLSFQEFLTARYLAETERDVARIVAFIEAESRALDSWWREPILLTLGYLSISASEATGNLIRRLGYLDEAAPHIAPALATTEIAATAYLEWGGPETARQALAHNLADLLTDPQLQGASPAERAAAGDALGRLGDSRPGVGLNATGIPDITWCDVPEGEFLMGNSKRTDEMADDNERPQQRLTLPAYRISKYLVTNAQYDAFVQDGGYTAAWRRCWTDAGWQWKGKRTGPEKSGGVFDLLNHPVVNVTWYEATAFCGWLGRQLGHPVTLPSESQWEKAARGSDGRRYPWGAKATPEHTNYDETRIGATTAVGIFPLGASPYGALDMSGNAWEWCTTRWRSDHTRPDDDGPTGNALRVLRGGTFLDDARRVRCACRFSGDPHDWFWNCGFRVVAPPIIHDSGVLEREGAKGREEHEAVSDSNRT